MSWRHQPLKREDRATLGILLSVLLTELASTFAGLATLAFVNAILVVAISSYLVRASARETAPTDGFSAALVLAVVPVMRLLSLVLPEFPLVVWYLLVALPLALALVLALRQLQLPLPFVGLQIGNRVHQAVITVLGVPLGAVIAVVLPEPASWHAGDPWWWGAIGLGILSALEELLFRGLVQPLLSVALGGVGLIATAVLFGATYGGWGWPWVGVFVAVGALFGWARDRTGSIVGVAGAHTLLAVGLAYVWPTVLG